MNIKKLRYKITFTEPLLATASGDKEIHRTWVSSKTSDADKAAEELAALPTDEVIEKKMTVFPKDEKGIFLWDYQVVGFIKESVGVLCELGELKKITKWTFKRVVDSCVFVKPRRVYLLRPDGTNIMEPDPALSRPLRAQTMQGDRVALASSQSCDAGTTMEFTVELLVSTNTKSSFSEVDEDLIAKCMNYGRYKGTGQWRGGGYGRFEAELLE